MDLGLTGKVAIVTGASRGLGRAAASALAREGVQVLAAARSSADLADLERECGGAIRAYVCDMRDRDQVAALVGAATNAFGRLDIVVNNAAIAPANQFLEMPLDVWDEVFAVNVTALAVLSQAAGRHFAEGSGGKIINIASTSGILGKASLAAYSASKGAVLQLTKALAAEWARYNIQVNAIAPGAFATEAQRAVLDNPEMKERRIRKIPARRMADPEEIGPLVCYLASPASNFVSGAVYVIDGGETSKQ
jgi:2-deoxy-D-gluconate 3-dehydrogenase